MRTKEGIIAQWLPMELKLSQAKCKFAGPMTAPMTLVRNTPARPNEVALVQAPPKKESLDKHNSQTIAMFRLNAVASHR